MTIANFSAGGPEWLTSITALLGQGQPLYVAVYAGLIVFFLLFLHINCV